MLIDYLAVDPTGHMVHSIYQMTSWQLHGSQLFMSMTNIILNILVIISCLLQLFCILHDLLEEYSYDSA